MKGWVIALIILLLAGVVYAYNNPNILNSMKNRIIPPTNTIRLVPSEMVAEYNFLAPSMKSCAAIEAMGESQGVSDIEGKVCREACGKRNMDYSSYDCEKDLLVCYCIL